MSALQGLLKAVTTDRVAVEGKRVLADLYTGGPADGPERPNSTCWISPRKSGASQQGE